MKSSILRKKKQNNLEKFTETLSNMNPNANFYSSSERVIHTNLDNKKLAGIRLPIGATFFGNRIETSNYGFVQIFYKSEIYTVRNQHYR